MASHAVLRDQVIAAAVRGGRIPPEQQEEWRRIYDAAPLRAIDLLIPDRVQVPRLRATFVPVEPDTAYPASWVGAAPGTGSVAHDR